MIIKKERKKSYTQRKKERKKEERIDKQNNFLFHPRLTSAHTQIFAINENH